MTGSTVPTMNPLFMPMTSARLGASTAQRKQNHAQKVKGNQSRFRIFAAPRLDGFTRLMGLARHELFFMQARTGMVILTMKIYCSKLRMPLIFSRSNSQMPRQSSRLTMRLHTKNVQLMDFPHVICQSFQSGQARKRFVICSLVSKVMEHPSHFISQAITLTKSCKDNLKGCNKFSVSED